MIACHPILGIRQRRQAGAKIEAIKDCAVFYGAAIGGSDATRIVGNKIHPVKLKEPEQITDVLEKMR